jgi:glycerol-3-phosphate dehydrogenase
MDCAQENEILRKIAPRTIEDTGGVFIATPADPLEFSDEWKAACDKLSVPAAEISLSQLQSREPLLNPRIHRAFEVRDASLDSFDLSHALYASILDAGGQVLLFHRLENFLLERQRVTGATILDLKKMEKFSIEAEVIVNAAGPWAAEVASLASVDVPMTLGKGTMIAMASRMVNTVINRLKPPSDGDIAVPVGTVCVLGTTDVPVDAPDALAIEPWEIDLLLAEGDFMIPGLHSARALRAWAGIRPLYSPDRHDSDTHALARAHAILDHKEIDGVEGFISVTGGKLTTYRLMAEETVDLLCDKLEQSHACSTHSTKLLEPHGSEMFSLPERLERYSRASRKHASDDLICECEIITRKQLEAAIDRQDFTSLDDLRRDLRLGMGPCQAAFCAYRSAGIAVQKKPQSISEQFLADFLHERWKGLRPLAWGKELCQMDFMRRTYMELFGETAEEN